jgi:hypothetical protein
MAVNYHCILTLEKVGFKLSRLFTAVLFYHIDPWPLVELYSANEHLVNQTLYDRHFINKYLVNTNSHLGNMHLSKKHLANSVTVTINSVIW